MLLIFPRPSTYSWQGFRRSWGISRGTFMPLVVLLTFLYHEREKNHENPINLRTLEIIDMIGGSIWQYRPHTQSYRPLLLHHYVPLPRPVLTPHDSLALTFSLVTKLSRLSWWPQRKTCNETATEHSKQGHRQTYSCSDGARQSEIERFEIQGCQTSAPRN